MKLRVKEMIFEGIHLFIPQVDNTSIREGYTLNNKYFLDITDSSHWCNINKDVFRTFEEAKNVCNETYEIEKERKIIIHELPERE